MLQELHGAAIAKDLMQPQEAEQFTWFCCLFTHLLWHVHLHASLNQVLNQLRRQQRQH